MGIGEAGLPIWEMLVGGVGGLALFLYGMDQLTHGLRLVAGGRIKEFLGKATRNPVRGLFAGAVATSVLQSSSITTVVLISFVSANLISLSQSLGLIMGANVGTTLTAQLVAFKITELGLVLVATGIFWRMVVKRQRISCIGQVLLGLGLIFFGMELMAEAGEPLRGYEPFVQVMKGMEEPALGIFIGAIFTALVQSSSAMTVLVITLAGQGFLSLEAGIALIFGANIGTCVTALLAAMGKSREAWQVAFGHVLFNVIGVVIWYAFIPELAELVRMISPRAEGLDGVEKLAVEVPRQVANAHTVFNLANAFLLVGLTRPMAMFIKLIVRKKKGDDAPLAKLRYLDDSALDTPSLALVLASRELSRLGAGSLRMLRISLPVVLRGSREELEELRRGDDDIDALHSAIVGYLGRVAAKELGERERLLLRQQLGAANRFESLADMVATDLVQSGMDRLDAGLAISAETEKKLTEFHRRVCWSTASVVRALVEGDSRAAQASLDAKAEMVGMEDSLEEHLLRRLSLAGPSGVRLFRVEADIVESLRRIYRYSRRIGRHLAGGGAESGEMGEGRGDLGLVAG
jgi:phosphate:Na+ symporter